MTCDCALVGVERQADGVGSAMHADHGSDFCAVERLAFETGAHLLFEEIGILRRLGVRMTSRVHIAKILAPLLVIPPSMISCGKS